MEVSIRQMVSADVERMEASFPSMGWAKPEGYFAECYGAQVRGEMLVFVAWIGADYAGHLRVLWESGYPPFSQQGIPEINDLNVLPSVRRQRIGSRLLDTAEDAAFDRSETIGIGVGLHPGYNAAQRMYVARGYIPDGAGVTYRDAPVVEGQMVRMDDDLVLHLAKRRGDDMARPTGDDTSETTHDR